jgi:hypothetical protein
VAAEANVADATTVATATVTVKAAEEVVTEAVAEAAGNLKPS